MKKPEKYVDAILLIVRAHAGKLGLGEKEQYFLQIHGAFLPNVCRGSHLEQRVGKTPKAEPRTWSWHLADDHVSASLLVLRANTKSAESLERSESHRRMFAPFFHDTYCG